MIYADHAATTPLCDAAREAMLPFLREEFGNPSTLYSLARKPRKAVNTAREMIAAAIGAQPNDILFTSGGTESDNLAIKGTAFRYTGEKREIITSQIEHHAVLNSCAFLERMGYRIFYLPVDRSGLVSPKALRAAITNRTMLVSIMLANNEIGTIRVLQPDADFDIDWSDRHGAVPPADVVYLLSDGHHDAGHLQTEEQGT